MRANEILEHLSGYAQEQQQQLALGLCSLLELADLAAAKALVALALCCKADCSLLGAVVQPQLLQQVGLHRAVTLSEILSGGTRSEKDRAVIALTLALCNDVNGAVPVTGRLQGWTEQRASLSKPLWQL